MIDGITELGIRNFLKSLDSRTLYDAGIFSLNLNTCEFEVILKSIRSKMNHAVVLKDMIDRDFNQSDENSHVLIPKDPAVQYSVISEYFDIKNAINIVLGNKNLYALYTEYVIKEREKEQGKRPQTM